MQQRGLESEKSRQRNRTGVRITFSGVIAIRDAATAGPEATIAEESILFMKSISNQSSR
jgi:hypothetical protein